MNRSFRILPKTILIITIILTILATNTLAEQQPIPVYTEQTIINNNDLQNTILQDGIKTRTEITAYTDRKITEMISTVKTDGQKFIDDNFKVFDQRIHELALKIQIQFLIGIFCTIILAQGIWFMISRIIQKKDKTRPKYLPLDLLTAKKYGLISPEYEAKINAEDKTIVKPFVTTEEKPNAQPPSMNEIEAIIEKMKQEKKAFQQAKTQKEIEKKLREEAKKQEQIDKELAKLKLKEEKKTRHLREKIKNLEQEKQKLDITELNDPFLTPPLPPKGI